MFAGNLDVAAFMDAVQSEQLDLVLRIGPWVHGEIRNGGFPDWVQSGPTRSRSNDPEYLALVREWWGELAGHLGDRVSPDRVLAIQLENEYYDDPDHLLALKSLAREVGFSAPLWTATAWGRARLPERELFPVYGGYGDGFWVDADVGWDPAFRQHFLFSQIWDDPAIGADLRSPSHEAASREARSTIFPPATCELGGGMATAYHRRPAPSADDIAAVAHVKLGNGSAWQGYYMFVGGQNPVGELQESHATGYPNDMPAIDYDFHAPIGASGRLSRTHAALRRQHAFIAAFGPDLVGMPSHLPADIPMRVDDGTTLRWSVRGDDRAAFLFIAWHQPHVGLEPYREASFQVDVAGHEIAFPSRPITIPPGTIACWPLRLPVGGVMIEWLTATLLTLLPGDVPVLVAVAAEGIPVEIGLENVEVDGVPVVGSLIVPPVGHARRLTVNDSALDLIVIPAERADEVWVISGLDGKASRVLLSRDEVRWTTDGDVTVLSENVPSLEEFDSATRRFEPVSMGPTAGARRAVRVSSKETRRPTAPVPASFGSLGRRSSAPRRHEVDALASIHRIELPAWATDPLSELRIDWAGDVALLRVDGRMVADRFWDGSPWYISPTDIGFRADSLVELLIVPLHPRSDVSLPSPAEARRVRSATPLARIDRLEMTHRREWTISG